jgi:hypothetical protein
LFSSAAGAVMMRSTVRIAERSTPPGGAEPSYRRSDDRYDAG